MPLTFWFHGNIHAGRLLERGCYNLHGYWAAALKQLDHFLNKAFSEFGAYEDAMTTQSWAVNHSLLSPYLNVGLLHAEEVVAAYNNLAGENDKLRKMIDDMAIKIAKHTVEISERDVVIQTLKGMLTPEQGSVAVTDTNTMGDTDGNQEEFNMGVQRVGSLANRFKVYKNPYMTENIILMGYRGSQFLETGAVYAPYVPLMMTPLVYDPETFTPRKGLMTRYAKKMIRPEFYGKIFISDLDQI